MANVTIFPDHQAQAATDHLQLLHSLLLSFLLCEPRGGQTYTAGNANQALPPPTLVDTPAGFPQSCLGPVSFCSDAQVKAGPPCWLHAMPNVTGERESQTWGGGRGPPRRREALARGTQVKILPHPSKSQTFPISVSFPLSFSSSLSWPQPCFPSLWLHGPHHCSLAAPEPLLET